MANERKVFDITRPTATASSRPVIASVPTPDPMVNPSLPRMKKPAPPPADVIDDPKPSISHIPVNPAPPPEMPAAELDASGKSDVKPALPGAPASNFDLQAKVSAHPLFSGAKDRRVKVRRMPRFLKPVLTLLILIVGAYMVVDAGLVGGASHLPFHVFKQPQPAVVPAITQPSKGDSKQPAIKTAKCTTEACFAPRFKACEPATLDSQLSMFGNTSAVHYQINEPKKKGCNMTFEYTENPNPDWVNKTMTCNFDNKKSLDDSVSAAFKSPSDYQCTGSFVKILNDLGNT